MMGFPVVEATANSAETSNQTSHTVNLPAGISSGDLLIVFFATDGYPTITFPNEGTDWVVLDNYDTSSFCRGKVCYRIADGGEGATITVTTSVAEQSAHIALRISGYADTPESGGNVYGSDDTPDPPSLSPSWGSDDTLWIACCFWDSNPTVSSYPTNYSSGQYKSAVGCGVAVAFRELAAASEDPGEFTLSAAEQHEAGTIGVKPAASGWQGTVCGVSNPAEVETVAAASISEVDGVASA